MIEYSLGIDTSNYKTSVALVNKAGEIVYDGRVFLNVPEGSIGLRQQEALFQHVTNLPDLISQAISASSDGRIVSVSTSNKPRPLEGSYMPCFIAGENQCKTLSCAFGAKKYFFSHQEGHLEAALRFTELKGENDFIFFHFSGGTTEILRFNDNKITQLGESLDISYGQLLDRLGSKLGYSFPAGEHIDKLAMDYSKSEKYKNELPVIKVNELRINLSGIETAAIKLIDSKSSDELSYMLMERITESIISIIVNAEESFGINKFLFAGGVSSSSFIKKRVVDYFESNNNIEVFFAAPELSGDNAVGIAFLGGDKVWLENQ